MRVWKREAIEVVIGKRRWWESGIRSIGSLSWRGAVSSNSLTEHYFGHERIWKSHDIKNNFRKKAGLLSTLSNEVDDNEEIGKKTKVVPFLLADIGEGIAEVEIMQWFVGPGDHVSQFDRVCEVQSDKATVEITSRFDGEVVKVDSAVGDFVSVGCPLLHIRVADEGGGDGVSTPESLHNVDDEEDRLHIPSVASKFDSFPSSSSQRDKALATPAVRKIAKEHDIDLSTVMGTGPKGRVLKSDLLKLLHIQSSPIPPSTPEEHPGTTVVPIRGYNRLMIKSMTSSLSVPHMTYADEIDVTDLLSARRLLKSHLSEDVKLTPLVFAIKAASLAIGRYPVMNSVLDAEKFTCTHLHHCNIGVAMDTPRGLAVPVIRNCESRSLVEIANELQRLHDAAKQGALSESDISDATFTLSNIGTVGGTYMSPIITPPQVAIGAIGKIQRLPRFLSEESMEVEARSIVAVSFSGDHRVVDGATMARFCTVFKGYLEDPVTMILDMK